MKTAIHTNSTAKVIPQTEIEFQYPVLTIYKDGKAEDYAVSEFPTSWDGRAFRLDKPDGDFYHVFVCRRGQNHLCECRGFESTGHCKHHDAVRHLVHNGDLDDPRGGFVGDDFPSPQQLADEAGVELPF